MNKRTLVSLSSAVLLLLAGLAGPATAQDKSGREGLIVYMGNDIFGVKWRNWRVNFKALGQLGEHAASLQANPPIKPGALDPYEPPN